MRMIDFLKDNRIELNTIISAVEPEAFWNWLKAKIVDVWPSRNYNRSSIQLNETMQSPTMIKFVQWYEDKTKPIIADDIAKAEEDLLHVNGLIDDIYDKQSEIENYILNNTLLPNKEIQELDKTLEKIMKNKHDA